MKRISLFLGCLFAAVSVFAGNLSGLLNKVGVVYDYDYVFVTNIADNSVKMEGTLNAEALAVEGLAVQVMVDGKVVGDATISHDIVSYAFAGSYAQEDVIQANLLFKYKAGQTVTSGINYVVAYETQFNVTVPEGSETCYLVFAEEGLDKAVEMEFVTFNAMKAVVPFNAWGKEYYYSLKAEENFYEVDATGAAVTRVYAGEADTVAAWYQTCVPYYELVLNDTMVVAMEVEGLSYVKYDLELTDGTTLQIREHLRNCKDSITNIIAVGDEPLPFKLLEGHLALMQLDGIYNVVFNTETRELRLTRHSGNMLYLYKNYSSSDIDAKPYAGFNATAERVVVGEEIENDYYLQITTGKAKTAVAGLVGNAYGVPFMKQIVENPSALVFDYKNNIEEGTKTLNIVKTAGDPAFAEPVFSFNLNLEKTDDWKTVVIYLDEWLADKSVLAQENEGDSYYILFDIASDNGLQDGELDIRDMYYAPYIKYSVTVPEGTEICYLKDGENLVQMANDAPLHYTLEFYDQDRYSQTYNYYAGLGDEFVEVGAKGEVVKPRYYHIEDVVVAWKATYCLPKYSFLFEGQKTSFKNVEGTWLIESFEIVQRDSEHNDLVYYAIDDCTEDTLKVGTVPLVAGKYKIELNVETKKVTFTKLDDPVDPEDDQDPLNQVLFEADGGLVLTWGADGRFGIPAKYFEKAVPGMRIVFDIETLDSGDGVNPKWGQAQVNYGDWSQITTLVPTDILGWAIARGETEIVLTQEIIDNILAKRGDFEEAGNPYGCKDAGIIVQGDACKINKVSLKSDFYSLFNCPAGLTLTWGADGRFAIPAKFFENAMPGMKVVFDIATLDSGDGVNPKWGQAQVNYGDWSQITTLVPTDILGWAITRGEAEIVLTQEIIDNILAKRGDFEEAGNPYGCKDAGIIVQGDACAIYAVKLIADPTSVFYVKDGLVLTWGADGRFAIPASAFDNYKAKDELVFDIATIDSGDGVNPKWGQAQVNYGDWSQITTLVPTDLLGWAVTRGECVITLTDEILANIQAKKGDFEEAGNPYGCKAAGVIVQGDACTIYRVFLRKYVEPAEECFEIVEEAFNALDEKATYVNDTIFFAAANSAMNMWLGGIDLKGFNTLTIEYEATTDFQVLLQDAQGEEQFVAFADTNIVVYHYLANVDMANLMQFIFVAQDSGAVKLNSICFSQVEYPTYYLGNKWNGAEEVSFLEMSTNNYGDWTVRGVLGSDELLLAFEAEPKETVAYKISEIAEITGKELLVGDEVELHCFEFLGNKFAAEVLARPTYVKHPWKDGSEWIWQMMTRNEDLHQWEYTDLWGGQGFNINAAGPYDNDALWFAANSENVVYITYEGEVVAEPAIGTKVTICYHDDDTFAGVRIENTTGLNSVKGGAPVIKLMENGQMFIIRDNKVYNIVGAYVRNK